MYNVKILYLTSDFAVSIQTSITYTANVPQNKKHGHFDSYH